MLKEACNEDLLIYVNSEANINSKIGGDKYGAQLFCIGAAAPFAPK